MRPNSPATRSIRGRISQKFKDGVRAVDGGGTSAYVGIAAPRARTVRLATTRATAPHPVRRSIAVRERLFAFRLPDGTGPVELRQLAANGRTVTGETLRR